MFYVEEIESENDYSIVSGKFKRNFQVAIENGQIEDKKFYSDIEGTILKTLESIGFDKNLVGTYNLAMVISSLFYVREMLQPVGVLGDIPYQYINGDEFLDLDNPNCQMLSSVSFSSAFPGEEFLQTIEEAKKAANLESLSNNEIVYSIVQDLSNHVDEVFTNKR